MSTKELSEVGRRYLFLRTELEECPDLANDNEFMRRYNHLHRMYRHYRRDSRKGNPCSLELHPSDTLDLIRRCNDGGVI
jgi:hypothetical protein